MDEHELREALHRVKTGQLGRRAFMQAMLGLGMTGPMVAQMLAAYGVPAHAQSRPAFTPPSGEAGGSSGSSGGRPRLF